MIFGRTKARIDGLHEELARLRDRIEALERDKKAMERTLEDMRLDINRQSWEIGTQRNRITQVHRKVFKQERSNRHAREY
ncbi:hypothetical protein MUN46_011450 [Mesosutterella sp. AGMB02718]|uniref:Uncharacterized protein n=1 Tax=Mesosutterella faecium TaxID=2925194 RepID=A0ABT7IQ93_9BURK|nr:hypothetical protein [Mesosutterella sp. AGMB02718]MDL2060328.1 hypothetical protein [Mesosutterella sp. AGMB02718]MDL2060551.1 hypothetical protein [Mesosutterella sp. AGMB02718]